MIPTIAVTIGDPAGVGPEIALKATHALAPRLAKGEFRLRLIGAKAALEGIGSRLSLRCPPVARTDDPVGIWPIEGASIEIGKVAPESGRQAYEAVAEGVRRALSGEASAIVTAPLNKESLHKAGYDFAGHTELLAHLTGARDSAMMLAHGSFRVSHVTTHIALEDVPKRATSARVSRVLDLTIGALKRLGIPRPRIAVAALNPHAGEGGIFGYHDIRTTMPIVEDYRARGFNIDGPVPGDTVFVKLRAGAYDAVLAMYHDQGHIPVKLLGFQVDPETGEWLELGGVNITLGLPIVRTSVDHGTAFDIAGAGKARESSLLEAVDCALALAKDQAA